jgi:hypothetical protein
LFYSCAGGTKSVKEAHNYKYHDDTDGWENTQSTLHEVVSAIDANYKRAPDPDFPEDDRVLGYDLTHDGWQTQFVPAPACPILRGMSEGEVCLYGSFSSVGILDNSRAQLTWFSAAVAALLAEPMLIISCFPNQGPGLAPDGTYQVRLFDPEDELVNVTDDINDLVPITAKEKGTKEKGTMNEWSNWTPVCYKSNGPEIYLMLLEKAAAKLLHPVHAGSDSERLTSIVAGAQGYEGLEKGGSTLYAWALLTGLTKAISFQKGPNSDEEWTEMEVSGIERFGYTCTEIEDGTFESAHEFFERLEGILGAGFIVGATVTETTSSTNPLLSSGIVAGHVYGMQQAHQVSDGTIFVQLRNPWFTAPGAPRAYNGPYGFESSMWRTAEGSSYASQLGYSPEKSLYDGFFWMEWSDFLGIFDVVVAMEIPR